MTYKLWKPVIGVAILLLTISCKIEPQAIEYGKDQCSFCAMNIVDRTHASQYVTKKGKQFKFDAIECLVHEVNEKGLNEIEILLVADFGNPGSMINATTASFLISEQIKSPMGANLSALNSVEKAQEIQSQYTGEIFNWEQLLQKLSDK